MPSSGRQTPSGRTTPSTPRSTASIRRPSEATSTASSSAGAATPSSSRLTAPTLASAAKRQAGKLQTAASNKSARIAGLANAKAAPSSRANASKVSLPSSALTSGEQDAISAYLRIRPAPEESSKEHSEPYIKVVGDKEVLMTPPVPETGIARSHTHSRMAATKYTFAKVFGPDQTQANSQAAFFQETTLPMVRELLHGESGLIFTYGVTNSGKSYTVQGGSQPGEAGMLPRALDVVFNSIEGLDSKSDVCPVGLYGVERAAPSTPSGQPALDPWSVPTINKRLTEASRRHVMPTAYQRDPTSVKVDRNYRYSVWASYVEVYNEKLYDLLDVGSSNGSVGGLTRSESVRGSNWSIAGMASSGTVTDLASAANSGSMTLNRRPLSLKNDPEGGGKYVAGLREVRVKDVEEARELLQRGQENRIVFSTMANRSSSRSHGVFTIKVVREHAGSGPDDSLACSVSRLSIVDLAGSERISNTSTSGQRQKEAGSINKSLMCLGQCLETLRRNQARAASLIPTLNPIHTASTGSGNTEAAYATGAPVRPPKRRPSVVPFRHSKLTELFQPFFTGEGRTVMIVNANPYDTGFDENSHVMKFSAVAKEVNTASKGAGVGGADVRGVHRLAANPPTPSRLAFPRVGGNAAADWNESSEIADTPPQTPKASGMRKAIRPPMSQDVTVIEEEQDDDGSRNEADSDDDSGSDAFIDLLIAKHEELRQRLWESEARCKSIEAAVREEMAEEMAQKLMEMEQRYTERWLTETERNEEFVNRKLDLLASVQQTPRSTFVNKTRVVSAQEEEDEEEESLVTANDESSVEQSLLSSSRHHAEGGAGESIEESVEESVEEDDKESVESSAVAEDMDSDVDELEAAIQVDRAPRQSTPQASGVDGHDAGDVKSLEQEDSALTEEDEEDASSAGCETDKENTREESFLPSSSDASASTEEDDDDDGSSFEDEEQEEASDASPPPTRRPSKARRSTMATRKSIAAVNDPLQTPQARKSGPASTRMALGGRDSNVGDAAAKGRRSTASKPSAAAAAARKSAVQSRRQTSASDKAAAAANSSFLSSESSSSFLLPTPAKKSLDGSAGTSASTGTTASGTATPSKKKRTLNSRGASNGGGRGAPRNGNGRGSSMASVLSGEGLDHEELQGLIDVL